MYDLLKNKDGSETVRMKGYRKGPNNAGYRASITSCHHCHKAIGCDADFWRVTPARKGIKPFLVHKQCALNA